MEPDTGQRWPDRDMLGQNRSAPGAAIEQPVLYRDGDGKRAMREMTPDEIRLDEIRQSIEWIGGDPVDEGPTSVAAILKGLKHREAELAPKQPAAPLTESEIRADELKRVAERLQFLTRHASAFGDTVIKSELDQIFDGRIEALRPEQPTSVEELTRPVEGIDTGLRYRQDTIDQVVVSREQPWRHDGAALRLTIDYQPNASESGEYAIPPYQIDQLAAIAAGRPSWPDVQSDSVSDEPTPSEPSLVVGLSALVEKLTAETADLKATEEDRTTLHAAELAMQLLSGDHKGLLDREAAGLLANSVVGGLSSLLVGGN